MIGVDYVQKNANILVAIFTTI